MTDLAEGLTTRGYEVRVLCAAESGDSPVDETKEGVTIRRIRSGNGATGSLGRRALGYLAFYVRALRVLLVSPTCDLAIYVTSPPFVGILGVIGRLIRRQRYAIWSHDLHPEAEVVAGILAPSGALARILHRLDRRAYESAEFVVDLGRCMKRRIQERGIPGKQLVTIPVWSRSEDVVQVRNQDNPLRRELGLQERFVIMYAGNAGVAHDFDAVLEVVRRLRCVPEIFFLFVGGGARRAEIEAFITRHGLKNFHYVDYVPRECIRWWLSVADVHVITLLSGMSGIAVPSKMSSVMGVGRPVLMVGPLDSEVSMVVQEARCGVVVDPGGDEASDQLEHAIRKLASNRALRERYGENGRRYFLRHLTAETGVTRWDDLLKEWLCDCRWGDRRLNERG